MPRSGRSSSSASALLLKTAFFLGSLLLFGGLPPRAFTSALAMLASIIFLWLLSLKFGSALISFAHRPRKAA